MLDGGEKKTDPEERRKTREEEKERWQREQAGLLSRGQRDNVTVCELYTKQAFCDEFAKKAAAKNSYFSFSEHPSSSQRRTAELNAQRLIVWHASRCLSGSSALCSLDAPGCVASFDPRRRVRRRKEEETCESLSVVP